MAKRNACLPQECICRQASALPASTGKNREGTAGSHGLCYCLAKRKMETLGSGCKNQDLNRGREEAAATITIYRYHRNFSQLTSANEQEI